MKKTTTKKTSRLAGCSPAAVSQCLWYGHLWPVNLRMELAMPTTTSYTIQMHPVRRRPIAQVKLRDTLIRKINRCNLKKRKAKKERKLPKTRWKKVFTMTTLPTIRQMHTIDVAATKEITLRLVLEAPPV